MSKKENKAALKLAPEALFIFGLVAVVGWYAAWRIFNPPVNTGTTQSEQQAEQALKDLEKQLEQKPVLDSPVRDELAEFYKRLAEVAPTYVTREVQCPLDNTPLALPVSKINEAGQRMDNSVGGIASDFMKIAVGPPAGSTAMPDVLVQQWEQLPVTCPDCLNTYQEQDLNNLRWPERLAQLRENWDLAQLSPALARIDSTEWTPDLVQFDHYLSTSAAGTEHIERGWTALSGAYASNFSVWSGEHGYYIPAAAFYALAASEFQTAIDLDWEGLPDKSKAETVMALLVCQRLLGRADDARATIELARQVVQNEPAMLPALEMEEKYLNEGRFSLERVNLENRPAPPIGWQLDLMLPAMNGHISEFREQWAVLLSTDEIVAAINERIAAVAARNSGSGEDKGWNQ
ncbi:hypothetical protein KDL29_02995 [bacterium]|nr:hypothetical protein [bacterium]